MASAVQAISPKPGELCESARDRISLAEDTTTKAQHPMHHAQLFPAQRIITGTPRLIPLGRIDNIDKPLLFPVLLHARSKQVRARIKVPIKVSARMRRDDRAGVRPERVTLAEGLRVSHIQRHCEEPSGRVKRGEHVLCRQRLSFGAE